MTLFRRSAIFIFCSLVNAPPSVGSEPRVNVTLDTSEAEHVLAILSKRNQGIPIMDSDWNAFVRNRALSAFEKREAAMKRDFSDDDFRKFVLTDELAQQYGELARTLAAWK